MLVKFYGKDIWRRASWSSSDVIGFSNIRFWSSVNFGHFMGKKSMSNGAVGDLHSRMKHAEPQVGNMDKLITHAALQVALQALLEDTQDSKILPNRARLCAKCLKGY
ncbi:neuromedin Ba isoform X2 [Trichomycterus rosablanca]|uniref:neuromedin Ba isoform X2 n=1 Tax=Trichomycterus rosablanca TaxID=2290929 RepID=UPI002F3507EB